MLGAYIFVTVISSSWIDPLIMSFFVSCNALYLILFYLKLVFLLSLKKITFVWYLYPGPHFQSVCVPRSEVDLLQTIYIGLLFFYPFNQSVSFGWSM